MKPLIFVGTDEQQLTTEQFQQLQDAVITAVRKPLVGRMVMPITELGNYGIQQLKFYKTTDMSAAAIGMAAVQQNMDVVGLAPDTLNIPVIWKDFVVYARDLASSERLGIPLDTANATDAGRRVAEAEETLIWEGLQGFIGFMGAVGRLTEGSAGAWSTPANAYKDVNDAIAQLENAGYGGRPALVVTPAQMADLRLVFANTGIPIIEKIQQLCTVYMSFFFADNASALMVMPDAANFELQIGQNAVTQAWELPGGDYFFRVYEALIPQFKRATSICEITGITV